MSNIDKVVPTLSASSSSTAWTNSSVLISYSAGDTTSGIKSVTVDGTIYTSAVGTHSVSANGTYSVTATDNAGNTTSTSVSVANIDKVVPTLTLSQSPVSGTYTNDSVVISYNAGDTTSGLKSVSVGAYTYTSTSATYTVTANGTYSFTATDNAGNTTTSSITVSNIDKTAPTITLTQPDTDWSDFSTIINFEIADTGGAGISKVAVGTSTYYASGTHTVNANGTYSFVVYDNAGNSNTSSIKVENIDTTAPTISYLYAGTQSQTNSAVSIYYYATDTSSGFAKLVISNNANDDTETIYSNIGSYSVSENATYTFKFYDNVGNTSSETIVISNIDKQSPTISYSANTDDWDNSINIYIEVDDDVDIAYTVVSGNSNSVTYYDNIFIHTVTANGTYTVTTYDTANNSTQKSIYFDNIDTTSPYSKSISPSTSSWTNQDVNINLSPADSSSGVDYVNVVFDSNIVGTYDYDDFETIGYLSHTATTNGIYYFYIYDNAGNMGSVTYTISNIDTTEPIVTYIAQSSSAWTNSSININIETSDGDGSQINKIVASNGNTYYNSNVSHTIYDNGTYYFTIYDVAGNTTYASIDIIDVFDLTSPTAPVISHDGGSSLNNTDVNVTITSGEDFESGVQTTIYKVDENEWSVYSSPLIVSDTSTITAKTVDNVGNETTGEIVTVLFGLDGLEVNGSYSAIDVPFVITNSGDIIGSIYSKTGIYRDGAFSAYSSARFCDVASAENMTNGIAVAIQVPSSEAGHYLKGYATLNNSSYPITWESFTGEEMIESVGDEILGYIYIDSSTFNANLKSSTMKIVVEAYEDEYGYKKVLQGSETIAVSIDVSAPTISATFNKYSSTVSADFYDSVSGISEAYYSLDGGSFIPYSVPIAVTEVNSSVVFVISDNVENVTTETVDIVFANTELTETSSSVYTYITNNFICYMINATKNNAEQIELSDFAVS